MILQFPTKDDQNAVKTAVDVFLHTQSGYNRYRMKKACRAVLDRYGVSKMCIDGYVIERSGDYASITAKKQLPAEQRTCPNCGAEIYPGGEPILSLGLNPFQKVRILSIREKFRQHHVTYGCKCGQVFAKKEVLQ